MGPSIRRSTLRYWRWAHKGEAYKRGWPPCSPDRGTTGTEREQQLGPRQTRRTTTRPPASHRVVGGPVRELFRLQGRARYQRRVPRCSRDDVQEELRSSAGRGTSGGVSRKATGQLSLA